MINWAQYKFYAFPPFSLIPLVLNKIQEEQASGICVIPNWPTQAWFPKAMKLAKQRIVLLKPGPTLLQLPNQPAQTHPLHQKLSLGLPLVRDRLDHNTKLGSLAKDIIMASWRSGTGKQYQSYLSRWESFCKEQGIHHTTATVEIGIDFLASIFQPGLGYSAINTARSALSSVIHTSDHNNFGTHPLVVRLLKGGFQLKPSLPKYSHVWDVGTVLNYLDSLGPASELDLKMLTKN